MTTAAISKTDLVSDSREPLLIPIRQPRRVVLFFYAALIGILIPASHNAFCWLVPSVKAFPSPFRESLYGLLVGVLFIVCLRLYNRFSSRTILATQFAWRTEPTPDAIPILIDKSLRLFSDRRVLKQLGTALREMGFVGRPIIGHWTRLPPPSQPPLNVAFEPIPLDEAHQAFLALEDGFSVATSQPETSSPRSTKDELTIRRLRKAYLYTGAWISVALLGSYLFIFGIISLISNRFDPMLLLFAFMLLVTSLPLLLGGAIGPAWLLVPGGLVLRKAKKRKMATDVHLFHPVETSLLIRPLNKRLWQMIVSDEKEFGTAQISDRELTMLLRAWCSPLAPPSPEKLIDLT